MSLLDALRTIAAQSRGCEKSEISEITPPRKRLCSFISLISPPETQTSASTSPSLEAPEAERAALANSARLTAADLLDHFNERSAICEFDGGQDRARAEQRAWREAASIWYRRHGEKAPDGCFAGCLGPLPGSNVRALPHGEAVHTEDGDRCLVQYGRRWKRQAATALRAIGILTPTAIEAEIEETKSSPPAPIPRAGIVR